MMQSKKSPIKKKVPKTDKVAELTEDLKRIQADFVNYKRRAEEDQIRSANSGKYVVVQQLLPVLDNVLRAINHAPEDLKDNEYVKGVQSIAKQIESALANVGVGKIDALNADFDPQLMEAVSMEDGEGEKEVVIEVMQEGYVMGDQVIRHAMVKVGKR
jgi:molecular chaperone GrpE